MFEHADSVKKVSRFFTRAAASARKGNDEARAEGYDSYVEMLDAAADEIVRLSEMTKALPPDLGSLSDLPPELLSELSATKTDVLEDQIVTVINAYGGEASLDQILVALFRRFKEVQKRRFIQNKLYRMPMVWSVDGRKGVYTTKQPSDTETHSEQDGPVAGEWGGDDDSDIPF